MRYFCSSAFALAAMAFTPFAASAETLEDALAYAYQNNSTLLAQRAYLRAVDENVSQAMAGFRPQVALVGNVTPSKTKTKGSSDSSFANMMYGDSDSSKVGYGAGVNLSQPIFSGFKTVSQTKAAENQVEAERANLRQVEQNVLTEAAMAYVDVLRDKAILDLRENNEKVLKKELERAEQRFKVGEITRTDVAQTQSRYSGAVAARIAAEGTLQISRANYRNVVGKSPEDLSEPKVLDDMLPISLENTLELAEAYNPSVIAAEYNARASWYNVNQAEGSLLPEVSLEASARKDWNSPMKEYDTETYQASANLTIPLYQGGAVYSKVRQAKQTANQFRILKEKSRNDAVNIATQAWESLVSSRASIKSIETQIEASVLALEGVKREAEAGERTVLDVLNAEQELLDNRVSLVSAQRDEIVSSFNLMAAVGRMTASNLALNVDIYNPSDNYEEVKNKWIGTSIEN
ncbi:MAG: TolC family outer membrane protein [Alphaproteobacteria bacterium]|nr:TolC family outer membrane protein [Alphaproteobacteria bacterium]